MEQMTECLLTNMDSSPEETEARMEARNSVNLQEMKAMMKAWLEKMKACLGATETCVEKMEPRKDQPRRDESRN
jgi:hypothetical protein